MHINSQKKKPEKRASGSKKGSDLWLAQVNDYARFMKTIKIQLPLSLEDPCYRYLR